MLYRSLKVSISPNELNRRFQTCPSLVVSSLDRRATISPAAQIWMWGHLYSFLSPQHQPPKVTSLPGISPTHPVLITASQGTPSSVPPPLILPPIWHNDLSRAQTWYCPSLKTFADLIIKGILLGVAFKASFHQDLYPREPRLPDNVSPSSV